MNKKITKRIVLPVLLLAVMSLAACGSGGSSSAAGPGVAPVSDPTPTTAKTPTVITDSKVPATGQTTRYSTVFGEDPDYTTNPMSFTDNGDGTITDNLTKLVWQKNGDTVKRTWADSNTYCNFNTAHLPGTGWRLPTASELASIVDYGEATISIDTTYFKNTNTTVGDYWTATDLAFDATNAWLVNFVTGDIGSSTGGTSPFGISLNGKSLAAGYTRCVRGALATAATFTDNRDGTVSDLSTGLMWMKQDDDTMRSWEHSIVYCEGLSFAGHSDWRLPNVKELLSLVDYKRSSTAINPLFKNLKIDTLLGISNYWTSTTVARDTSKAWQISFYIGETISNPKTDYFSYSLCVR